MMHPLARLLKEHLLLKEHPLRKLAAEPKLLLPQPLKLQLRKHLPQKPQLLLPIRN